MNKKAVKIFLFLFSICLIAKAQTNYHSYVDPKIGTQGYGNVIIGPSCPFGMIKPGPDNSKTANSGYKANPKLPLIGFSQLHVSGTGGGAKYGNISVMLFASNQDEIEQSSLIKDEKVALGYYGINLIKGDINVAITTAPKTAFYKFEFKNKSEKALKIDAGAFLNEGKSLSEEEAQFFIGSEIEIISDHEVIGHNSVRGGWNAGGPYTVYFYATFDQPFENFSTWKGSTITANQKLQYNTGEKTGALLHFKKSGSSILKMKIAISFISTAKAKQNLVTEVRHWDFDQLLKETEQRWEQELSKIKIDEKAPIEHKKMFYTGLYHTLLMPVDRSGENPLWKSDLPYYDDFYAIWDTFRSSSPLLTLINSERQTAIVNSLLDIYQHDGYMPDARSGNSNGRTQGGSNADVVIADAFAKGLKGIDYNLALKAMIKNATVSPGGNEEKEGRGGLQDYLSLGYISDKYPRAGTRTVEYAYNDYCIAQLAKGLGDSTNYYCYKKQSGNWKNLWRDIENNGAKGFIMPKDSNGQWIDSISCTLNKKTKVPFDPTNNVAGECVCWWCGFFYEGSAWDYSFYVPQNIPELIKYTGGAESFKSRLDTFFNKNLYDVSNEPDFLTPNLYHWIGRPDLSSQRINEIIKKEYNSSPKGIPGNDDSGAMSSWLVFHMMGLYPNAGQNYYLINSPILKESLIKLENNKSFKIIAKNLSSKNSYIKSATLNNKPFTHTWLTHNELVNGGVLVLEMSDKAGDWGKNVVPPTQE
ncbi:alpha-mannosidase [Pedobacter psychrophilus]|uniref:Alpha-mannosidase n=1 Tax=Pedobacter psychrophilus TaxID=1826909 RepID=A0A179DH56_9SPHI|nr:GH92 family glycosyl hydrolase [Pedobacter psychrophilus]OAQ39773.1 alpha-mannosidase [Pedobacter psychrophilus]